MQKEVEFEQLAIKEEKDKKEQMEKEIKKAIEKTKLKQEQIQRELERK
jgi:hypothetical protein